LAIGIGIGSSFIVLVSFIWGIFVFGERVHSRFAACIAIFCMMIGLLGMSYYSSPPETNGQSESVTVPHIGGYEGLRSSEEDNEERPDPTMDVSSLHAAMKMTEPTSGTSTSSLYGDDLESHVSISEINEDEDEEDSVRSVREENVSAIQPSSPEFVHLCGTKIAKRHAGMIAAAFCGAWGGSIMAPMKFCKSDTKGTHYLMSFSIGASIVTVSFWLLRYLYNVSVYRDLGKAYAVLPSFHLRVMWLAGGTSGLLWSIGNFFSLISVFYLGEGVGYPLVQTSILVAGLWGIFFFKEVKGKDRIVKWLSSALLTIFGILLLSYEHHET
jgi:Transmembrane family, TMEM144 of transporters